MKSISRLLLVVFTILFSLTTIVSADSYVSEKIKDLKENGSILKHSEKDDLLAICDNSIDEISESLKSTDFKDIKKDDIKIGFNEMYKVYYVGNDVVNQYKSNKSFSGLITDKYEWEVPIFNKNDDSLISTGTILKNPLLSEIEHKDKLNDEAIELIEKNQGKWQLAVVGSRCHINGIQTYLNDDSLLSLLKENNMENITELKMVIFPTYFTYVVYINDGSEEYGVPFTKREDLVGVNNGKLYSMSDLLNIFEISFAEDETQVNPVDVKAGGGTLNSNLTNNNNNTIIISISSLFIAIFIAGVVFLKKRHQLVN